MHHGDFLLMQVMLQVCYSVIFKLFLFPGLERKRHGRPGDGA